jgi:hypothetical protein
MKKSFITVTGLLYLLLFFTNCGKNETGSYAALGKEYFPLSINKTIVYDVDSVIYDPQPDKTVIIDTTFWQVREVMKDTFRDLSGILNYRVERYHRRKGAINWDISQVNTMAVTNQYALRNEQNLRYIKLPLVFGLKTSWDGNIYNDPSVRITVAGETLLPFSKKWTYQILSFGESEKIGDKTFTDVLTIQAQTTNILNEKRSVIEKYAKEIGLVFKEEKILDTQKLDANIAWEKKAEKGFIVNQRAILF